MSRNCSICKLAAVAGMAMACAAVYAQAIDPRDGPVTAQINLASGPVPVTVSLHLPTGMGLGQQQGTAAAATPALTTGLPFHTAVFPALGSTVLPINFVGLDPRQGASTTVVPTVIVPLRFIFPNTGNPTLDGTNVVTAVVNSPIFQNADYMAGPVDLGVTQFGDALLRGEFWNLPGFSHDYHVLLAQPIVNPTITINVPAGLGNAYQLANSGYHGVVDTSFFESMIANLAAAFSANQLPIFLTDNVNLGTNGLLSNCCIVGYHASQGPPAATARTWIYAAYEEPGTYNGSELGLSWVDTVPLSHEISEWLNDPFVGGFDYGFLNFVPPAALTNGSCAINFETGDPLESAPLQGAPNTFTEVTNGTTYHLQDEVFLPWYLHIVPSFSVNGWYTFQNVSAQVPLVVNSPAQIAGTVMDTATTAFRSDQARGYGRPCVCRTWVSGRIYQYGQPGRPVLSGPDGHDCANRPGSCAISLKD